MAKCWIFALVHIGIGAGQLKLIDPLQERSGHSRVGGLRAQAWECRTAIVGQTMIGRLPIMDSLGNLLIAHLSTMRFSIFVALTLAYLPPLIRNLPEAVL